MRGGVGAKVVIIFLERLTLLIRIMKNTTVPAVLFRSDARNRPISRISDFFTRLQGILPTAVYSIPHEHK